MWYKNRCRKRRVRRGASTLSVGGRGEAIVPCTWLIFFLGRNCPVANVKKHVSHLLSQDRLKNVPTKRKEIFESIRKLPTFYHFLDQFLSRIYIGDVKRDVVCDVTRDITSNLLTLDNRYDPIFVAMPKVEKASCKFMSGCRVSPALSP